MSVSCGQASGPWSEDGKEGKLLPVDPMSPISTGGEERPANLLRPAIGQKVGHEPQEGRGCGCSVHHCPRSLAQSRPCAGQVAAASVGAGRLWELREIRCTSHPAPSRWLTLEAWMDGWMGGPVDGWARQMKWARL